MSIKRRDLVNQLHVLLLTTQEKHKQMTNYNSENVLTTIHKTNQSKSKF